MIINYSEIETIENKLYSHEVSQNSNNTANLIFSAIYKVINQFIKDQTFDYLNFILNL